VRSPVDLIQPILDAPVRPFNVRNLRIDPEVLYEYFSDDNNLSLHNGLVDISRYKPPCPVPAFDTGIYKSFQFTVGDYHPLMEWIEQNGTTEFYVYVAVEVPLPIRETTIREEIFWYHGCYYTLSQSTLFKRPWERDRAIIIVDFHQDMEIYGTQEARQHVYAAIRNEGIGWPTKSNTKSTLFTRTNFGRSLLHHVYASDDQFCSSDSDHENFKNCHDDIELSISEFSDSKELH
jgi:hypothetical protein